jgi:predicted Zn-dependent protease
MHQPIVSRIRTALARCLAALSMVLLSVACQQELITGRKTLQLLPAAQVDQMGVQAYQQILSESKLSTDREKTAMIDRVGGRIAAEANRLLEKAGRQSYDWEFTLIDSPEANAFALPGGKVAFYTGILPICQTEEGVAVVMGHEVGHVLGQHGNSRVSMQVVQQFGLQAVEAFLSGQAEPVVAQTTLAALGIGTQVGALAFSRRDESAADHMGLVLMAQAGYDPREAIAFWQRMRERAAGPEPPAFLSTHPPHDQRISDIQKHLPEALAIYERQSPAR